MIQFFFNMKYDHLLVFYWIDVYFHQFYRQILDKKYYLSSNNRTICHTDWNQNRKKMKSSNHMR